MSELVKELLDDSFGQIVNQANVPVLVDFWAPWCGPCKALTPVIEQLAEKFEGKALIVKVNADEAPETVKQYNVRGLPTVLILNQGEVVNNVSRLTSLTGFSEALEGEIKGEDLEQTMLENLDKADVRAMLFVEADAEKIKQVVTSNPEYLELPIDEYGSTPVSLMIFQNNTAKLNLLLELGAKLTLGNMIAGGFTAELKQKIANLSQQQIVDEVGGLENLMRFSVFSANTEILDLVFPFDHDINNPGEHGAHSLLQWVLRSSLEVMQYFANKGLDYGFNWQGYTCIHMCWKSLEKVRFLVEQGVDSKSQDVNGNTVLDNLSKSLEQNPECQKVIDYLNSL